MNLYIIREVNEIRVSHKGRVDLNGQQADPAGYQITLSHEMPLFHSFCPKASQIQL